MWRTLWFLLVALAFVRASAAQVPTPTQGDFVLEEFRFGSGEVLPELRVHYRTLGRPERDAHGVVRNAVLLLHGTTGSGASFLRPEFAGELFPPGGLPELGKIRAPLLAVNSADDLINPPELGILEREIKRVPKGRAVVLPLGPDTRGHGTHTHAAVWKRHLEELLSASAR